MKAIQTINLTKLAPHPIANPMRRPVPLRTILRNSVVAPRRPKSSPSLVLKSGIQEGHWPPAIAAAPSLALPHQFYAPFVLLVSDSRLRVADFPSIRVYPDCSAHDGFIAQGFGGVVAGARDGAATHSRTPPLPRSLVCRESRPPAAGLSCPVRRRPIVPAWLLKDSRSCALGCRCPRLPCGSCFAILRRWLGHPSSTVLRGPEGLSLDARLVLGVAARIPSLSGCR